MGKSWRGISRKLCQIKLICILFHLIDILMADTKTKIDILHQEILDEFKRRNDTLLSLCESPIEKLFLLQIIQFFYDSSVETHHFNYLFDIVEPVLDPKNPTKRILDRPVNFMEKNGGSFLFMKGIKVEDGSYSYQILPQHSINIEDRNFRLDFAIIIETKGKSIPLKGRYCIECDGHEFHNSKQQITRDNERMRLLTKFGWTVLRYSGSEIYGHSNAAMFNLEDTILSSLERIN